MKRKRVSITGIGLIVVLAILVAFGVLALFSVGAVSFAIGSYTGAPQAVYNETNNTYVDVDQDVIVVNNYSESDSNSNSGSEDDPNLLELIGLGAIVLVIMVLGIWFFDNALGTDPWRPV